MLPMRPMAPAHASIASLSVVLPDDACPTMAKFRRSPAEGVAITQICSCSKHASNSPPAQAENLRLLAQARCASAIQIVCPRESIADRNRAGSRFLFLAEF